MIAEGCSPRLRPAPLRTEEPRGDVMVEPEAVAAMLRLKQLGWGRRRIARELGMSRGTVKRYLAAGSWQPFKKPRRKTAGRTGGLDARAAAPTSPLAEARATVRFETPAGKQLQIASAAPGRPCQPGVWRGGSASVPRNGLLCGCSADPRRETLLATVSVERHPELPPLRHGELPPIHDLD